MSSKPVYYQVIINKNDIWKVDGLCFPLTKTMLHICTYHQSFQYGTATKAVHAVPVVYYSKNISNMVMGYMNYLPKRKDGFSTYDRDPALQARSLEEPNNEENKNIRINRDGTLCERHTFICESVSTSIAHHSHLGLSKVYVFYFLFSISLYILFIYISSP